MNTKRVCKIISIVMIVITILSAFSMVFADPSIPTAIKPNGADNVENIAGNVIYVIQVIAFAAGVIMLMFLGIKFVTASPEGKAEIKKSAVIYLVGAVLLFAAGGVLSLVRTLASNVGSAG